MRSVTIRPVYLMLAALCLAVSLAGCATTSATLPAEIPAMHQVSEVTDGRVASTPDPWYGFNRGMYKFNYNLDKYLFLPVVNSYEFITPTFVQTGVSNFFNNIGEIRNLTNNLFQLKGKDSLITLGRFATNSTIGIAGLFDPATSMGMEQRIEDFGQTLGYWGVGTGNYLVLPLFGPSNVRDTGGLAVDSAIHAGLKAAIDPLGNTNNGDAILMGVTVMNAIDKRHVEKFRYNGSDYPFEYDMVRWLAGEKRKFEAMK